MSRANKIFCAIGDRGTGKTPMIVGDTQYNVPSLANIYVNKGCVVIVVDTLDNSKYTPFVKDLKPGEDLSKLKPAFYRIITKASNVPTVVQLFNLHLRNAFIIYEDSYRYFKDNMPAEVIDMLLDSKQKNIETLFVNHAFGWVAKDLYRVIDDFIILKSGEHPSVRKKELGGNYEKVLTAYNRAIASPNKYYNETVIG